MRITRKQIKAAAAFFPGAYSVQDYPHGFEVICYRRGFEASVFFSADGKAMRTDMMQSHTSWIPISTAARHLGLT